MKYRRDKLCAHAVIEIPSNTYTGNSDVDDTSSTNFDIFYVPIDHKVQTQIQHTVLASKRGRCCFVANAVLPVR